MRQQYHFRNILEHTQLINNADLQYPIILCHEGRVMDGLLGLETIKAVRFSSESQKSRYLQIKFILEEALASEGSVKDSKRLEKGLLKGLF